MKLLLRALGTGALILAAGCTQPAQEPPAPGVLATFEGGQVTDRELDEFIVSFPPEQRQPAANQTVPEWRRERLEALVLGRLLEREALEQGLLETGGGAESWRRAREALLISAVEETLIAPRVAITEEHLREFYDANPSEFGHDGRIRLRHIFKRVDRDAAAGERAAVREELAQLRAQVEDGGNFDDIARQQSDSETAPLGGLIGRIDHGVLEPGLENLLFNLEPGGMSDIVDTPMGFHVFKLDSKIEPFRTSFEEARGRLTRRLTKEARGNVEAELLKKLLEDSGAEYRPERLSSNALQAALFSLGGEQITLEQFRSQLHSESFAAARELPLEERLEQTVLRQLFLWEAEGQGMAEQPEIAAALELAKRSAAVEIAKSERYRRIYEGVPEARLREVYDEDDQRYQTPRLVRMRLLTLDFPEDQKAWYAVYESAAELRGKISGGEISFEEAARQRSTDFSRLDGGDVGAIRVDALTEWAGPSAGKVVSDLAANEISPPLLIERYNRDQLVYDRAGFMLVQATELIEPGKQSFEAAKDSILGYLVKTKAVDPDALIRADMRKEYDLRFFLGGA